jgi:hypothetical protein
LKAESGNATISLTSDEIRGATEVKLWRRYEDTGTEPDERHADADEAIEHSGLVLSTMETSKNSLLDENYNTSTQARNTTECLLSNSREIKPVSVSVLDADAD